ncbi:SspB family protein [Flaviflagellibacter deserti]|uniref:SspB family protein n=1 Tax=Flaviflagellibacter deserti TaxID=2267266 RepID=A0ABV9Z3Q4_9HYPH
MATDLIRYDLLAQEALRGVVRRVLEDVARTGVPGEHHFYISFNTEFPGVRISPRLREKYPEEMTIILQHQFWDLSVGENGFEVGLSFSNVPEKLYVPFDAITGFFDPSVKFGLKFEALNQVPTDEKATEKPEKATGPRDLPRGAGSEPAVSPPAPAQTGRKKSEKASVETLAAAETPSVQANPPDTGGAEIVSLDKFRKK